MTLIKHALCITLENGMKNQKGYTVIELAIAVVMALAVVGVIGGIWVAVHFIAKLW